ncbi:MAG: CarD family transcriptional regulator [Frisingicoccus sp.]|uniref:CarD family transcriptional regulator n=1 Tax=Frisingicoccus sp. TaxID=1918627 RepID=UPI002617E91C|nr:CarD family transcriptional regulator [Frisingicoccus sp.]MDD6233251.1 CarD family transcriptional regulator [Frisingicoccus sp.]
MYKIGDYIVKNGNGVCRVDNVMHLDMSGIDKNRLYYLLVPIDDENGKVYLPVDTSAQQLRKVMTSKEAYDLIAKIPDIQEISIANDKSREQRYKETIKNIEPESLLRIIKTTYLRKKERLEQGKKNTAADEYYLTLAKKHLFSELCLVLGKDKEEVHNLIVDAVNKN